MKPRARKGRDPGSAAFDEDQRKLLAVTMVPLFMSLLGVSIVNVILPSIETGLGAGNAEMQWVLSGYSLSFGVVLVAAGRAGDVFGRGRLFVIGIGIFGLGSLGAGFAPTAGFLNFFRVVMGIGSGLLNPQVIGMMQRFFSGVRRGKAFGLFGGAVGVSVSIGPVLGGLLVFLLGQDLGWRASFLINVPIALIALLAARSWLPQRAWREPPAASTADGTAREEEGTKGRPRIDLGPFGTLMFAAAVLLLMLPFMDHGAGPWVWAMIPLAAVLLWSWTRWERKYAARGRSPMVDLSIFRTASFANGSLLIGLYFIGMTSVWVLVALYLQRGQGFPALEAGLVGLPSYLASAVVAPIAGRHMVRIGRPLVLWGIGIVVASLLLSALFLYLNQRQGLSVWWLTLSLGFAGIGQAMVSSPNQTLSLAQVPLRYAGSAGGVMQTGQRIGQSVGIAAITGIVFASVEAGGWGHAVMIGFFVISGVVVLAGAVGVKDQVQSGRARGAAAGG